MKTGSLSRRTVVATLGVLIVALGGFATLITLRYRDGLRARARSQLLAGARAVQLAPDDQLKPLIASLALEGVEVDVNGGPAVVPGTGRSPLAKPRAPKVAPLKPGTLSTTGSHLLTVTVPIRSGARSATAALSTSEANVDSSVNRLIVTELVAAAAVLVAASILTLLASRSALRPLRHVAAVAQRIASGDRRLRLRPRRPDTELGRMAASFDAMVDSLEAAVAQATRSEAGMRRFLADASHELRTPIAGLQASAETLLRQQPPRPRRDQLEAELARGVQRLGRLVDDLLNLARLEAHEPLRAETVDLTQVGESLVSESRARSPAQISIAHEGPATVIGDPDALTRALRNLLDNALTAGGDAGAVRLEVRGSPTAVKVTITDDGPGVPADDRERIFEGFVRLNGSSGAGTGLGLAITRAIARQHHGSVTCDECASGARFTLELPTAQRR
ncbi:MAG TPA: HAMP domain-containing sensor histidine kinase [Solirubrobacteraceae bacterium]